MTTDYLREIEGERRTAEEAGLAEQPAQLRCVEAHSRRQAAPTDRKRQHPTHVERQHPAACGDAAHLACRRQAHAVVDDRGEARELHHDVEFSICKGQVRGAAYVECQRRVPFTSSVDAGLHEVDAMTVTGPVFAKAVQEVAASAADVENAGAGEWKRDVCERT